ncbi:Mediator of RNA polymerase II transcription subunit 12 [Acorus calamus]|uniref:Mediator of RNA polymerase II transcription subunit 12 n=1 Tax=Acorus calamus TaxID=4465 RepID=A0AAV9C295_ACOCL|nr:Mediator of RNA polymerase II transcription subunit 12 [Acorus calamus]
MAKKKSRKRPARREKGRAGCMWGLINMFDFRQGRFTQKMISDRKRESGRLSVGDEYSRSRYNLQTEFQENHKVPDTGCADKSNGGKIDRGKNDIRRSVRVLMEEEMSEMQRPNRISRTKSNETRSDSGRGRYTEKNLMQENKTYKVAGSHASGSLETDDTHYADIMEVYSRNLNSNKELLLKHLHEQKLILVKHIHDVQSDQAEEMASIELPKILERRKVVDDVIISQQCESLVGSQQLHKHGMSIFFRKKEKIQSNKSLKDSDQDVDHIVLLKPSSSNVQNPKSVVNLSTSPHCQNSFRSQGESERTSFHFSLREMKRRLKQAIGDDKKERRSISRDGVLHRIPQGFQGLGDTVERIVVDDVKENLCHKTTDNSQRRSETSAGPQRRENKGKSNGFQLNIGSEVTSSRAYRIQKEAKKRLADLLSIKDGDMDLQSRLVHKPLGRILSLPDYNLLSPRFSPGRDPRFSPRREIKCSPTREKEPIFVPQPIKFSSLQKAKQEVTASPLIWSMENLESSSVTNEESGIELQVPNLIPGLSEGDHDMISQEGLCIKDDKNPEARFVGVCLRVQSGFDDTWSKVTSGVSLNGAQTASTIAVVMPEAVCRQLRGEMQRSTTSCGGGVSNSSTGGTSSRDSGRADSSFSSSNYSLNPRRPLLPTPYKLKCDKESLNSRLGPPDFYPQTPNCPEETLTREYLQAGYKDSVEGIEEAKEIQLTHLGALPKPNILKCKEAIRKRLRAINESRAQKRKAGQVYGVPLSGSLLSKPGGFPEQRPCGEDFRKKWIEIKPVVTGVSPGVTDKAQRSELWTKDVIEYLQYLLDDFFPKDGSLPALQIRDQTLQPVLVGTVQQKADFVQAIPDMGEPSLQFKWWYMVQILQWHNEEGLLLPSLIIDWVLSQLQEKEFLEALELLLPIIFSVIETIALSQTYVRIFVDVALRFIHDLSPGASSSSDNPRRACIASAMVDILRYLILAVPDTFVALDCFPLPVCLVVDMIDRKVSFLKVNGAIDKSHHSLGEYVNMYNSKQEGVYYRCQSIGFIISSLQKCAANLGKIVNPGLQGHGVVKIVQVLDKTIVQGDVRGAFQCLFDDQYDGGMQETWIAEVSPLLRSSMKWIRTDSLSMIHSVFFLCEWATCDFRDFRTAPPRNMKFTGHEDFSNVYVAVLLLKLKMEDMRSLSKNQRYLGAGNIAKVTTAHDSFVDYLSGSKNLKMPAESEDRSDIFQSPGPLHDIVVCWLDQHEVGKGESFKRLHVFIMELIRFGIFYPPAYVRQLIVSGIMDRNETIDDQNRQKRHYQIIKQLPVNLFDVLEEARIAEVPMLIDARHVYKTERRLILNGLIGGHSDCLKADNSTLNYFMCKPKDNATVVWDGTTPSSMDSWRNSPAVVTDSPCVRHLKAKTQIAEMKAAISVLLHLPNSYSAPLDESQASLKRPSGSLATKIDLMEGTLGCDECRKMKRQKPNDERSSRQGFLSNHSDDEDTWWVRKGPKSIESFKVELPNNKSTKQTSRGRQKIVRKTQSLAQLQAARIEGSQGASTSHICDNKVVCPHHKTVTEVETPKGTDRLRVSHLGDIGKSLKGLRWSEKRCITVWLIKSIKLLVEGSEKAAAKVSHSSGLLCPDDNNGPQWILGEEELLSILYVLDVSSDLFAAVKFLLWLFPRVFNASSSASHVGRNILMMPKNKEYNICEVSEAFILSSLQRYENIIVASDLLPEVLSIAMHRAGAVVASNVRSPGSLTFLYGRNLLKKYGNVSSVVKWVKNFKATCDQRIFAELETVRPMGGDLGFSVGNTNGSEDFDDYIRQKICGRISRVPGMKEIVQKHIEEAVHSLYGRERNYFSAATLRGPGLEKVDDGYHIAQRIVLGLVDCIRQNGVSAHEGDLSLVASAVSAIVSNVGSVVAKMPDFTVNNNFTSFPSTGSSLYCVRRIIHIHVLCLRLLKEALGERQVQVFEITLATEASSTVSGTLGPGKALRSQFHPDGLDIQQFIRNSRSSSNGVSHSVGAFKVDNSIELYVHWFMILIGNCRTVADGLVAALLDESYILALSRMQRMLPLSLVFPPAYSIFAMVIWRPYILKGNGATCEDSQSYQFLSAAIGDAIRHPPFRDVCLRDTCALYDLLSSDASDSEFAALLELHGPDKHMKTMAFVPLRARLFLSAIVDSKMPQFTLLKDDGSFFSGHHESQSLENEKKPLDQLVHVLDTLQPAKFHWQWVELRLLLNEQTLIEKIEAGNVSLVDAIRSMSPKNEDVSLSENENSFSMIVMTRLLVRPDAAPLYSEVLHLLGRSMEEKLLMHVKWLLAGSDVLLGRKSIQQRLMSVALNKRFSIKSQFWKPWGWSTSTCEATVNRGEKRKQEATSIEEGEFVEEGIDNKKSGKIQMPDAEIISFSQPHVTEKALAELVLPCIDRSSSESRIKFAADLIKQMNAIEQQISAFARGASKQSGIIPSGEGSTQKGSTRKGIRGGSPGLGRKLTGATDSSPPSAAALRASMWLRLQFLLRLLPVIYGDRETSGKNMRHMLASVILRLLGSRVVYEDAELSLFPLARNYVTKRDMESVVEASVGPSLDFSGDSLFDRLLYVLHGLLSSCKPSWLKPKSASKSTIKSPRDFSISDRELVETLQLGNLRAPISSPRSATNALGKSKPSPSQDPDLEFDPWTLLEDGTGSMPAAVSGDHSDLMACSLLRGAVRMRRTDLTYIGTVDDDN